MATILDFGLLKVLHNVFPFLFILILVYAVLSHFKLFKENPFYAASIALLLSLMSMFSPILVKSIERMAPYFVLLILFIVLLLITYQSFGVEEKTILDVIKGEEYGSLFGHGMLAIVLVIVLGSFAAVVSEEQGFLALTGEAGEGEQAGFFKIVFHPSILGFIAVMLIALFTVLRLSEK